MVFCDYWSEKILNFEEGVNKVQRGSVCMYFGDGEYRALMACIFFIGGIEISLIIFSSISCFSRIQ